MSGLTKGLSFLDLQLEQEQYKQKLIALQQEIEGYSNLLYDVNCELKKRTSSFCLNDIVIATDTCIKYKLIEVTPEYFIGKKLNDDNSLSCKDEILYKLDMPGFYTLYNDCGMEEI